MSANPDEHRCGGEGRSTSLRALPWALSLAASLLLVCQAVGCMERPSGRPAALADDRPAPPPEPPLVLSAPGPPRSGAGGSCPAATDATHRGASSPNAEPARPSALAQTTSSLALVRRYPGLASHLPIAPLAQLPTPVERLDPLGRALGLRTLYVKRDDRGATTYGGNKVRKLELELGAAVAQGKTSVLTFGGVGSNHALATALYARSLGLRSLLMLLPEPPTPHVRHNLLAELAAGAEIQLASPARIDELVAKAEGGRVDPSGPYVIAPGGSSTLGNIAFVSAAFELAEQIAAGELPEPDALFVAMGTGGTAVGLAIGLRAAGLRTRVFGVRASSDKYVNEARVRSMALDVVRELRIRDAQFPEVTLQPDDLRILHRYVGRGYALPTRAGARAAALALSEAGLELDPTYTAKTVAAIAGEAARLGEAVVLYWHTYDARSVPHDDVTTEDLPAALRGYARAKR